MNAAVTVITRQSVVDAESADAALVGFALNVNLTTAAAANAIQRWKHAVSVNVFVEQIRLHFKSGGFRIMPLEVRFVPRFFSVSLGNITSDARLGFVERMSLADAKQMTVFIKLVGEEIHKRIIAKGFGQV